ncbi:MAG: primosomal protein N' [Candidatus Lernaella stagnicola]|nr:primosomal protein N' [Candidatus Lernaella stagnicola]
MTKRAEDHGSIAEVAVGLPVSGTFHYRVPPELRPEAKVGVRVQVPFGKRKMVTGFILSLPDRAPEGIELRDVADIPDREPLFVASHIPFYRFISDYYFAPLGEVLRTALPAGLFSGSRQVLAITPAGKKALRSSLTDDIDRRIVAALAGGEELTVAALDARLERQVNREAQRLVRWGWLEKRYRLSPLTAKRKYETCWRLAEKLALDDAIGMLSRRSEKRERLLRFLADKGAWASLGEIKDEVDNPRPTLNLLVSAGVVEATDREVYRAIGGELVEPKKEEVELTDEQQTAIDRVGATMEQGAYRAFCLHGVTGSGKTEIYIRLTQRVLESGRNAIVLVPEISLTPQFLGRFMARLGNVVAPYHSGLSNGERYDQWRRMQRGEAKVVVGARSALFAPFEKVGLIVVDEEHEHSFKQDDGVPYHARDMALKLATMHRCPVVLGSATPSLETYSAAQTGRYELLELTRRPTGASMPVVNVVDMRQEMEWRRRERKPKKEAEQEEQGEQRLLTSERRVLSTALAQALTETHEAGEQAILFLNRRGFSTYLFCLECGEPIVCPLCDISLTYYEREDVLRCHYCEHVQKPPKTCPKCASPFLFYGGMGTERLAQEVGKLLPNATIARLDRDAVRGKHDLYKVLSAFAAGEAEILVGTQMVAKGHDFPRVTLVGVVDADAALMMPDFRAAERAFSLISQVAGRAGRADRPGRVVLQSFQPEHYAVATAAKHDFHAFFKEEVKRREALQYPPAARLAVLKIVTPNSRMGVDACLLTRRVAAEITRRGDIEGAELLGPAPALLHRVHGKYRWNLLIKAKKATGLHQLAARLLRGLGREKFPAGTFRLDIDPAAVM